jgi:hypothetical protein
LAEALGVAHDLLQSRRVFRSEHPHDLSLLSVLERPGSGPKNAPA